MTTKMTTNRCPNLRRLSFWLNQAEHFDVFAEFRRVHDLRHFITNRNLSFGLVPLLGFHTLPRYLELSLPARRASMHSSAEVELVASGVSLLE